MSAFGTFISRCHRRILLLDPSLATWRLYPLRALSSGSERKQDDPNFPGELPSDVSQRQFSGEREIDSRVRNRDWKGRREHREDSYGSYPEITEHIPRGKNQPKVNLSNLMKSLRKPSEETSQFELKAIQEKLKEIRVNSDADDDEESPAIVGEEIQGGKGEAPFKARKYGMGAEQTSEEGATSKLPGSDSSELLNRLRKPSTESVYGDIQDMLGNWRKEREEKKASFAKGRSGSEETSTEEGRGSGTVDIPGTGGTPSGPKQLPQFKPNAELDNRVKNILSELKVESSHKGLAKGILGAVKNWGKTHPRHRDDLVEEYMSQERELFDEGLVEPVDFTSGSRPALFDMALKHVSDVQASSHKPFVMELDEGDRIQQLTLADARRNDFGDLMAISHRQWQFPVDNEVCKADEANVGFEEHIFLQYLLDEFPEKGPVRRFMELVINGLEQNPHLSVQEKKDQVFWFKEYFSKFSEEELNF